MKKIIAMLLAIVMVCALSVSVFAEEAKQTTLNDKELTVTGTYDQDAQDEKAYSVSITWGSLAFTYAIDKKTWNDETHKWEDPAEGGEWIYNGGNVINVTNDSSVAIYVTPTFEAAQSVGAITGSFTGLDTEKDYATLAAGVADTASTPTALTLELDGALLSTVENGATIGTITLALADEVPVDPAS